MDMQEPLPIKKGKYDDGVPALTGTVALVYPGLSEKAVAKMRERFAPPRNPRSAIDDGFPYPRLAGPSQKYYPRKNDKEDELIRKAAHRKKYRELRLAELEDEITEHDAVRTVAGIVFAKDEPKEIDTEWMEPEEVRRLSLFVHKGILRVSEVKPKKAATAEGDGPDGEGDPFASMHWRQAVALVEETDDVAQLEAWLEGEERKSVREAIEAKLADDEGEDE